MKQKIELKVIVSIIISILIFFGFNMVRGATGSLYLALKGLSTERETGRYVFNQKDVFKIVKSNQSGTVENDDGTVIYCLKGGPGFGSESYQNNAINYTQYFDIKQPNTITGAYRNQLPSDMTTYNELVWVLEHVYSPKDETMDEYLERAGISNSSDFRNGTIPDEEVKDIVEVIEQVAIWYFTNPDGDYHNNSTDTLEIEVDGQSLSDKYSLDLVDNEVDKIYAYLVEGAIDAVTNDGYTYNTNNQNPINFSDSQATATIEGTNYIIGPYIIQEDNTAKYTLTATLTDGTNPINNAKILNQNKQEITEGNTLGDKIQTAMGSSFYISIPFDPDLNNIKLDMSIQTQTTVAMMWTVGENELSINQPVVVLDKLSRHCSIVTGTNLPKPTGSYNLKLIKQDSEDSSKLEDVKFNIKINNGEVSEYETNSSGEININDIAITDIRTNDTIIITETEPAKGYLANNTPITLTITKTLENGKYVAKTVTGNENANLSNDPSGKNTVNITVNNKKKTGSYKLKLIKEDETTKNKLKNAKFEININNGGATEYTTDTNGEININNIEIENPDTADTITIKEIEAPEGYVLNDEIVELRVVKQETDDKYIASSVSLNSGRGNAQLTQDQSGINTVQINIDNTKISGKYNLKIVKTDEEGTQRLQNARFNIVKPDNSSEDLYTNSNGEITIEDIQITDVSEDDYIKITEAAAPAGYAIIDELLQVHITKKEENEKYVIDSVEVQKEDGSSYDESLVSVTEDSGVQTIQVSVKNKKAEGSYNLKIVKQDEENENNKLSGAEFEITTNMQSSQLPSGYNETTRKYTTDSNGEIITTTEIPASSVTINLTITETNPPRGYDAILTEPIKLRIETTEKDGKYIIESVESLTNNANYTFDEENNAITLVVTNKKQDFDLALRKYITHINGNAVSSREPQIQEDEISRLKNKSATFDNGTTAEKNHTKEPIMVSTGDVVRYTIRIYNEGKIDGYAKEITDYLPEGLELVPASESSINAQYGWTADGQTIKTTYLANTLLEGTDSVSGIDYQDIKVECRVVKKQSDTEISLKNVAEITEAEDILGNTEDIDSTPNNLTDDQKNNYNPDSSERGKGYQDDDDYEELILKPTYFDLSLRKFITGINGKEITNRVPQVDTSPLLNGGTTANYNHPKEPIEVKAGDEVIYTIRVYNEGEVDGYVEKIIDHLPPELEFLPDDDLNTKYGWTQTNERTVETDYLRNTLLTAFDGGSELDYTDIQIKCIVKDDAEYLKEITNIAEITEYRNELNINDRDNENEVNLPSDEDLPGYKDEEINSGIEYIPGQEDDDDFEKVILQKFDLALRKFITGVNEEEITNREPEVDTSKYGTTDENGNLITSFTYNHTKDPVRVCQNDIVIYTIRVYNEGTMSGYAEEIRDDIPEGLEYLPENEINQEYRWTMYDAEGKETQEISEAVDIRTDYLSKANETTDGENLLQAYNSETMEGPDYKDVRVAFKVTEPNTSDRIIINHAQISEDKDEEGEDVTDIDSTPDEWNEGEDDQDIEKIYVQYFDLALRKWVSQVILIEDGVEKVKDTGHYAEQDPEPVVRVDLNQNRIDNTIIKFKYQIRITNEGEIAGYATEISDYIPEGLEFNQADNPLWKEVDGKIVTDQLKDTILQPGESATVEVILTWINDEENMGVMINTAEISEDYNESGTPDIDSTPNNKVEGEDDIDDAPVALTMVTGSAPLYIGLTAGTLAIIAGGVFLIKKYVI